MADQPTATLKEIKRHARGTITSLPMDEELRSQCIRLGLSVGAVFVCIHRLPGGTIVLETNRQEIALGNRLAEQIRATLD